VPPAKKAAAKKAGKASPPPSPPPDPAAEPGRASSAASAISSAPDEPGGLVADSGPEFDAELAAGRPAPEPPPEGAAELEVYWEERVLKGLVRGQGRVVHAGVGVAEQDWLYTVEDLDEIVPALTRIANRYFPQLAKYADPAVLAAALMSYATRSLTERRDVIAAQAGDGGTEPIAPLAEGEEAAPPAAQPPAEPAPAAEAPRVASEFPTAEARPSPQEVNPGEAPPPPQPVEGIDPAGVNWER
jgi:hypothetical protein